jgi:glycosyltransferase involved in cell wall biosynthesis
MISFFGIIHQSGGCGAELLGAIHLLRRKGVKVRCITPIDDPVAHGSRAKWLRSLGVTVVNYRPGMFERCPVLVSFGEDVCFDYMREYADRPKHMVWTSGMSFGVDVEYDALRDGLIDEFFFQTPENAQRVAPQILKGCGRDPIQIKARQNYVPFIDPNCELMPLAIEDRSEDEFVVGRATRDDPEKWHDDSWRMYGNILVPHYKSLLVRVAGWGQNALEKVGSPCDPTSKWAGYFNLQLNGHIYDSQEMAAYYKKLHVLLHYYPFVESFGYSTVQAMLAGAIPIGADEGGFKALIQHGETGFLARSPDEATYYASSLAFDEPRRQRMSEAARRWVIEKGPGNVEKAWPWWRDLLDVLSIPIPN